MTATTYSPIKSMPSKGQSGVGVIFYSGRKNQQVRESEGAALALVFPRSNRHDPDFAIKCRAFQRALLAQARSGS